MTDSDETPAGTVKVWDAPVKSKVCNDGEIGGKPNTIVAEPPAVLFDPLNTCHELMT